MDSLYHGVRWSLYWCRMTKVWVLKSLVLPVLLCRCEAWTLTRDLRWRLNSFGTRSLWRILGYRRSDFVTNEWLLRAKAESESWKQMRYVRCIVREHQMQLYGHMACFSDADPAYQILSAREPCEWRSQRADDTPYGCSRLIDISISLLICLFQNSLFHLYSSLLLLSHLLEVVFFFSRVWDDNGTIQIIDPIKFFLIRMYIVNIRC